MPRKLKLKELLAKKVGKKDRREGCYSMEDYKSMLRVLKHVVLMEILKQTVRALNLEIKNIGGENVLVATGLNNLLTWKKRRLS